MLEVRDLHVRYGKVEAVSGISLDVAEGEVVGLIGPNGAGKTSTLSAIFGLLPGTSGSVRFLGQEISGRPPEWIVRRGMALVTEGRHIFGSLTVEENLWLGAAYRAASSSNWRSPARSSRGRA
jgi:branched-chain amino acid transport system ATP-binding protein